MIVRPASVLPVIVTRPVILFITTSSPTSDPLPVTTFTTPSGKPASPTSRTNSSVLRGVLLEGFVTTETPVVKAGTSILAAAAELQFRGAIDTTTPLAN